MRAKFDTGERRSGKMVITPRIWRNITFNHVEEIFCARPFGMQEYGSTGSTLGIYGFFTIKAGRKYLRLHRQIKLPKNALTSANQVA